MTTVCAVVLSGEDRQQIGADGVRAARLWLEATCRARVEWDNPTLCKEKLQYRKASASAGSMDPNDYFSFDIGGQLVGGDMTGKLFLAEIKNHKRMSGTPFREFLAKCYRTYEEIPNFADQFLWISWAPFLANEWDRITTEEFIEESVTYNEFTRSIALGSEANSNPETLKKVSERLVVVILSDEQIERLCLNREELQEVKKALLDIRGTG